MPTMAESSPIEDAAQTPSTPPSLHDTDNVGRPQEPLEVEEATASDDHVVYPTGPKLWLTMASVCLAYFLTGLDLTIVAVAVPSLTDQFKTVSDIGWYNAA